MATGFMTRHCIALLGLFAAASGALATDVSLIGAFDTKAAILSIDGGPPRTVKVGQTANGVTVISVEKDKATIEFEGKRRNLVRGQTYSSSSAGAAPAVTLAAGAGGHFFAEGQVNGGAVRFLVDTGATAIALPASEAERLRIDYRKGRRATTNTAAGPAPMYVVTLQSVRIGSIEVHDVEAFVIEQGLNVALLGNSFLNRMEMRREGQTMTLIRRF